MSSKFNYPFTMINEMLLSSTNLITRISSNITFNSKILALINDACVK